MSHGGGGSRDFLSGLVWGGLVGAAMGLLLAPRPGDETREMLRARGIELRERAMDAADQTRQRAEEMQQRGREMLEQNRERVTRTVDAAKTAAQEAAGSTGSGAAPGHTPSPGQAGLSGGGSALGGTDPAHAPRPATTTGGMPGGAGSAPEGPGL
jgi:gas vesicle protein